MAYRTKYIPKNKEKYIGDAANITCRSLWERNICKFCDETPNIVKWSSEEIVIPYESPLDKKMHNYYPDFLIQVKTGDLVKTMMVEVKPKKQTYLKENASKKEQIIWSINNAKWEAAKKYAQSIGYEFLIITEKHLP
jgi:hypothetical protein